MKGVVLRGNTYWFRGTVRGRIVQRSLGTKDEAAAIGAARELIGRAMMEPQPEPVPPAWAESVSAFLDYKKLLGNQRRHLEHQEIVLGLMRRAMTGNSPADVTPAKLQKWADSITNPRTRVMYYREVERFFRWMVQKGRLPVSPCRDVDLPKKLPKSVGKRFLSPDEADRLLATPCRDDLRFALYCMLHAGMRYGEVCAARAEWFDLDAGMIHIRPNADWRTKNDDNRTIPLTTAFKKFLKSYGTRTPYMLWPEKTPGKSIWRVDLRVPFAQHLQSANVPRCTFHDLRRTFASLSVSAGVPLFTVAQWLGDGVAVVEKHYARLYHTGTDIERAWKRGKRRAI